MARVIAIVQARMGSTRLPGKSLMEIAGLPVITYVIERVKLAKTITEVWLATTTNGEDDALARWAKEHLVPFYRGSPSDVLDRYYQTAHLAAADVVVRITGDCPLIDPQIVDKVVNEFLESSCDYGSNAHPPTFPDGLDTEVFTALALQRAWQSAKLPSEREHVTPYIWKHQDLFKTMNVTNDVDLSAMRWTLDTPEDFTFIKRVINACNTAKKIGYKDEIVELLNDHPDWQKINSDQVRNAGYAKSLVQDEAQEPKQTGTIPSPP
jgi:spore coat polysaccharide biosynthesis protein SpsF (cytidylyltransferase family)